MFFSKMIKSQECEPCALYDIDAQTQTAELSKKGSV